MNVAAGGMKVLIDPKVEKRNLKHVVGKAPVMVCPVCSANAIARTSEEQSPTVRKLWYRCTNVECGMSWTAQLAIDRVINPSAISAEFRQPQFSDEKPPGNEFGQMTIFEVIPQPPGA